MANPMARITEARANLMAAKRSAYAAWNLYTEIEKARNGGENPTHGQRAANRAQAATHLPEDMLELLGVDRYGSAH
jgi:hypothetical protein